MLSLCLSTLVFIPVFINFFFSYLLLKKQNSQLDLQQFKDLNNQSFLHFLLPNKKDKFTFKIYGNGGIGEGEIKNFCNHQLECKLPLIFGGKQNITIFKNGAPFLTQNIVSGENRFYCFYATNWNRRICRFRDICFDNHDRNMTFLSPYKITTDFPFLVLGGRSPPYDKKRDRIYRIQINESRTETLPPNRKIIYETTHFASSYYNMQMLWHCLFDFTLPLFYTFGLVNGPKFELRNIVMPHDADYPKPKKFVQAFSSSLTRVKNDHCYKDLIVGISKVKDAETGKFYEFPYNFTHQFHPYVFKKFEIISDITEIPSLIPQKPVILFSGRKTSRRNLVNYEEVYERLEKEFSDHFTIEKIFYEEHDMKIQIEKSFKASIMIGIHGSGLSHVCWMRPGTVMIEILPYRFDCRDWYKRATNVSAVKYFKYVPQSENESPGADSFVRKCWKVENGCDGDCLDRLRDQNISVNVEQFIQLMRQAINALNTR